MSTFLNLRFVNNKNILRIAMSTVAQTSVWLFWPYWLCFKKPVSYWQCFHLSQNQPKFGIFLQFLTVSGNILEIWVIMKNGSCTVPYILIVQKSLNQSISESSHLISGNLFMPWKSGRFISIMLKHWLLRNALLIMLFCNHSSQLSTFLFIIKVDAFFLSQGQIVACSVL